MNAATRLAKAFVFGSTLAIVIWLVSRVLPVMEPRPWVVMLDPNSTQSQRIDAADRLASQSPPPLERFSEAVRHHDPRVREAAAIGLSRIGPQSKGLQLSVAELLRDPSPDLRAAAALALGSMRARDESVIKLIADSTRDSNEQVKDRCYRALGRIGDPAAAFLVDILKDSEPTESIRTLAELRLVGAARDHLATIWEETKDDGPEVLVYTSRVMISAGHQPIEPLRRILTSDGHSSHTTALADLRWLKEIRPELVKVVASALRDSRVGVRQLAIECIARADSCLPVLPELIAVLEDSSENIVVAATRVLGKSGPKAQSAASELAKLQTVGSDRVRVEASLARASILRDFSLAEAGDEIINVLLKSRNTTAPLDAIQDAGARAKPLVPKLIKIIDQIRPPEQSRLLFTIEQLQAAPDLPQSMFPEGVGPVDE